MELVALSLKESKTGRRWCSICIMMDIPVTISKSTVRASLHPVYPSDLTKLAWYYEQCVVLFKKKLLPFKCLWQIRPHKKLISNHLPPQLHQLCMIIVFYIIIMLLNIYLSHFACVTKQFYFYTIFECRYARDANYFQHFYGGGRIVKKSNLFFDVQN